MAAAQPITDVGIITSKTDILPQGWEALYTSYAGHPGSILKRKDMFLCFKRDPSSPKVVTEITVIDPSTEPIPALYESVVQTVNGRQFALHDGTRALLLCVRKDARSTASVAITSLTVQTRKDPVPPGYTMVSRDLNAGAWSAQPIRIGYIRSVVSVMVPPKNSAQVAPPVHGSPVASTAPVGRAAFAATKTPSTSLQYLGIRGISMRIAATGPNVCTVSGNEAPYTKISTLRADEINAMYPISFETERLVVN